MYARKKTWEPKQRIIVPKGLIPPGQVAVIEVPRSVRCNAICVAERSSAAGRFVVNAGPDALSDSGGQPVRQPTCGTQTETRYAPSAMSLRPLAMEPFPGASRSYGMYAPIGAFPGTYGQGMYRHQPQHEMCARTPYPGYPNAGYPRMPCRHQMASSQTLPVCLMPQSSLMSHRLGPNESYFIPPVPRSEMSMVSQQSDISMGSEATISNKSEDTKSNVGSKKSILSKPSDRSQSSMEALEALINKLNKNNQANVNVESVDLSLKEKLERAQMEINLREYQNARRKLFGNAVLTDGPISVTVDNKPIESSFRRRSFQSRAPVKKAVESTSSDDSADASENEKIDSKSSDTPRRKKKSVSRDSDDAEEEKNRCCREGADKDNACAKISSFFQKPCIMMGKKKKKEQ